MIQKNTKNLSSDNNHTSERSLCVVVVDDNTTTVKLATYSFEQAGWKVFGFESPILALKELSDIEPDLIITDYRMPELNGPEFLLAAEQVFPTVPKLVMTAFDDDPVVQACLRKAGVPSVSKMRGLTEIVAIATALVAVRQSVKLKAMAVGR